MIDRRTALAGMGALAASSAATAAPPAAAEVRFPRGFLWGAATAGHQIEGNNVASDFWVMENVQPTMFVEPSGDALNGFELWQGDLYLVRSLGLNAYRFSLEWARIEPEQGRFSLAMLDHYQRIVAGCRSRGLAPVVTFNHFTTPRWFAAAGGWANPQSPSLFARFCERAARHLGQDAAYGVTLNEPNTPQLIAAVLPPAMLETQAHMLAAAARAVGSDRFSTLMAFDKRDYERIAANLLAAHKAGRAAIKGAAPQLPVGVSLALADEEAAGPGSLRDKIRTERYGAWMDAARDDDFIGVQNYNRVV
jgi:beta-glucosidase